MEEHTQTQDSLLYAPRVMLAAPKSGSGKTMLTCGILRALLKRGKDVAAFKCGPDYIDPQFHETVVHAPSRNLDPFFTDAPMTRYLFGCHARQHELSVIEGVMGYYDGLGGISTDASAYHLAQMTDTPVVLVMDAKGMSVSVLALLKGFLEFRKDSRIRGVIFNRMSKGMYTLLAPQVRELGITPLGYVPELPECRLESRHLGLVLPHEVEDLGCRLEMLAEKLEESLELSALLALAEAAPPICAACPEELMRLLQGDEAEKIRKERPVIAVSKDEAFQFLYADNLRLLEELGARLCYFSPLHDQKLPEGTKGLLLCGGYPELFAKELSKNVSMREEIRHFLAQGKPCLAECGGYMYLSETMEGMEEPTGKAWEMAGAVDGHVFRTKKLGRFGYIELQAKEKGILGAGMCLKAHEFHYFDSDNCGSSFTAKKPNRNRGWDCIHGSPTALIGFPHLYYHANPQLALDFLRVCCRIS